MSQERGVRFSESSDTETSTEQTVEAVMEIQPEADSPGEAAGKEAEAVEDKPETVEDKPETTEDKPETAEDKPETAEDKPETAEDKPETAEVEPETAEDKPEPAENKPETAQNEPATAEDTPEVPEPVDIPDGPVPPEDNPDTGDELPDDFLEDLHDDVPNGVANGLPSHMTESDTDNLKGELAQLTKNMNSLASKFDVLIQQNSRPNSTFGFTAMDQSLKGTHNPENGNDALHNSMAYYKPRYPPIFQKLDDDQPTSVSVIENIPPEEEEETSGDENKERGNWTNHADFILSCLGYAVGLGNVWRFPYLCYKNGGGAFFIPYFIMLFFVGMPIVYLEISLGQFTSQSCLTCWKFAPIFTGVGIAHYLISFLINIYYNVIIGWSFYYLFASFTSELPWSTCYNAWNTEWCRDRMPDVFCNETAAFRFQNGTCLNETTQRFIGIWNVTAADVSGVVRTSPAAEYYDRYVLSRSSTIDDMGTIRWELALCLLVAWVVVFFCLFKGVKSAGKAVYFTAIFPYVVITILLIRGLTLPGYQDGIRYYTTPDFSRLTDSQVWIDAAVQIFFSLSACMGGLITLASYNRFQNNCLRDTLIVCIGNSATSIFAGFAVFSFLGYQAYEQQTTVDKVATSGPGLAFVVYPDIIAKMPISPLWSILFFVMLITLGLDSAFAGVEACVSGLADRFPVYFRGGRRKTVLLAGICLFTYLMGLSMCSEGGVYMLTLFDNSAGGWAMLVVGIFESTALTWVYGPRRIVADLRLMCGDTILLAGPLPYWWLSCWCVLTPGLLVAVVLFGFVDWAPLSYDDYTFPTWADALGVLMTVFCVIFIPVYAVYAICAAKGTFLQRLWEVSSPTADWGPALPKNRRLVARYTPNFQVYPNKTLKGKEAEAETATNYDNPGFEF